MKAFSGESARDVQALLLWDFGGFVLVFQSHNSVARTKCMSDAWFCTSRVPSCSALASDFFELADCLKGV